jgi:hypothetical protein
MDLKKMKKQIRPARKRRNVIISFVLLFINGIITGIFQRPGIPGPTPLSTSGL